MAAGAFLWRGFDHEWLRSVLGFRLPHRLSKLDSYITDEQHARDGSSARLVVGQAPGVDGNFMRPVGYASAIWSPQLTVHTAVAELSWSDEISDAGGAPRAESCIEYSVAIDVGALPADHVVGAVLRGFALTSRCDPAKQPAELPCNSNGMWPYRFAIELGAVERHGATAVVPLRVECHRGWTPMRGGLPGIEEKPLNRCLDLAVSVHVTLLSGPAGALAFHRGEPVLQQGHGRDTAGARRQQPLHGTGGGAFPLAATAMTGFGFELSSTSPKPRHRHRGRYLGGLRFGVEAAGYDASSGAMLVDHHARLWLPRTVVASDVGYTTTAALVQLAAGARVTPAIEGRGSICACSSPQAPLFSRWNGCGRDDTGPAQLEDQVELRA